jgi:hypothetical protein
MMPDLSLYYLLMQDRDSHWIIYDLLLENNWAEVDYMPITPFLVGCCYSGPVRFISSSSNLGCSYDRSSVNGMIASSSHP